MLLEEKDKIFFFKTGNSNADHTLDRFKKLLTVLFPYISYKQQKRTQNSQFLSWEKFSSGMDVQKNPLAMPPLHFLYLLGVDFRQIRPWIWLQGLGVWILKGKKMVIFYRESRQKNESRWWQLKEFWIFHPEAWGR